MGRQRATGIAILAIACALCLMSGHGIRGRTAVGAADASPRYVVLGWNDLGMHCYDDDFSNLAILPPFNTLWVQVIKVGDPPQIVTDGLIVEYRFEDNTYSAGKPGRPDKTNFWQYAQGLFGLPQPLPPDTGLAGKKLSDVMDAEGDHFIAKGIPLTDYRDQDVAARRRYPFQKALITVRDASTRRVLARNTIVAPTSTEMSCVNCHSDTGDATTEHPIRPTGNVETNILALHDYLSADEYPPGHTKPLMSRRPVLCAECHSSNALGAPGVSGVPSLSNAMHRRHANLDDIPANTQGCYQCHPGPKTRCLRDAMTQQFAMSCINCHGPMSQVAQNPEPWLSEPRCSNAQCHGAGYQPDQPLYRNSRGHGGVYCAGCHDSPHAYAPSREANDGIKFKNLQGAPGPLRKCTVCHATQPAGPKGAFSHTTQY